MPPESHARARAWLTKADHDLLAAEELLRLAEGAPLDVVCFHAQQCVEKCLKGLLVWHSIDFPRTHDIVLLARLVPEMSAGAPEIEELLQLNRYAVETRYPGDWEAISTQEAEQAVGLARYVSERAARRIDSSGPDAE